MKRIIMMLVSMAILASLYVNVFATEPMSIAQKVTLQSKEELKEAQEKEKEAKMVFEALSK